MTTRQNTSSKISQNGNSNSGRTGLWIFYTQTTLPWLGDPSLNSIPFHSHSIHSTNQSIHPSLHAPILRLPCKPTPMKRMAMLHAIYAYRRLIYPSIPHPCSSHQDGNLKTPRTYCSENYPKRLPRLSCAAVVDDGGRTIEAWLLDHLRNHCQYCSFAIMGST